MMYKPAQKTAKFLYSRVAGRICADFRDAEKLPGERELAKSYSCTRTTVRAALQLLESEKMLSGNIRRRKIVPADKNNPIPEIVMVTEKEYLKDPNFMDFVAGCLNQASEQNCIVSMRVVEEMISEENFSGDILSAKNSAFLIACDITDEALKMLDESGKPCVIMGNRIYKNHYTPSHCFEYYIAQTERNAMVLDKMLSLGHRKILAVNFQEYEYIARQLYQKHSVPFKEFGIANIHWSISSATKLLHKQSLEIAKTAKNYTALWIPFGNVISFGIYLALVEEGIRIPEELSVVISSGNQDWFVPHYRISNVFSSAWEEGAGCIKEIARQLRDGDPVGGIHFTEYYFIDHGTLAPPEESVMRRNSVTKP